jgi:hypothetical protein
VPNIFNRQQYGICLKLGAATATLTPVLMHTLTMGA